MIYTPKPLLFIFLCLSLGFLCSCDNSSDVDGRDLESSAYVYWSNNPDVGDYYGPIGRVKLDGTGADQDWITGAETPAGIAVGF